MVSVGEMKGLVERFVGRSRLLLQALLSGGVNSAHRVFLKLRAADSHSLLPALLETLCQDEACLDENTNTLNT